MSKDLEVRAELAGNVFKILVNVGDEVAKGDQLVILESMKMEIPLVAPKAGVVKDIAAVPDAVVAEGDSLVIIEVSPA